MTPYKNDAPKVKVAARAVDNTPIVGLLLVSIILVLLGGALSGL